MQSLVPRLAKPPAITPDLLDAIGLASDPDLTDLVTVVGKTFRTPIAMITFAGRDTLWIKASVGLGGRVVARSGTLCDAALASGTIQVVEDSGVDGFPSGCGYVAGARFGVSIPLALEPGASIGTLCIVDTRPRVFSAEDAHLFQDMARSAEGVLRAIERVRSEQRLGSFSARDRTIYDRVWTLAKLGAWECDLATEALTWTDGVYDMFELPRGSALKRRQIVDLYEPPSRMAMETHRFKTITQGASFSLDVQIKTMKGKTRWIRLSCDVECRNDVPVRIFGLKQDITEERALWEHMRGLAERDALTGLANRAVFEASLSEALAEPAPSAMPTALLLVDLDGFKTINDTFGHAAGDECLRQVAARLRGLFAHERLVARLGGDEFAILTGASATLDRVEQDARSVIDDLGRPMPWGERTFAVGASIGIAIAETTDTVARMVIRADTALYAAKTAGRNTFRVHGGQADRDLHARRL